ncbi:hypothetical protein BU15DRAFT_78712 [Melanogaster broomeanus]|nr:hypothetical protein BU15DRAFT_78712 [Melanogaster broomeanus]
MLSPRRFTLDADFRWPPRHSHPKAPKKDKKDEDEEDKAFKDKKKAEEAALKAAKEKGALRLFNRPPLPSLIIPPTCPHDCDFLNLNHCNVLNLFRSSLNLTVRNIALKAGPMVGGGIKKSGKK